MVRSTGYKLIAGLAKKRLALMQHVVQDDGDLVTPVKKKHVQQPATETIMNLMDDIDAITAKGKGGHRCAHDVHCKLDQDLQV